ncbi:MAG: Glycerol uptake facilitator protein [Parcubacteria bacterium OLB19]|nr:MAG: Glycerol uptake facilitator protein [Parcubacteria bacterium OLB19]
MNKYIVEALGTGALTLVVGLSLIGTFPVSTPILAALTLGLFVYTIGHISGTHINPAVTLGAWSIGKIETKVAMFYIVAQMLGAGIAMLFMSKFATLPELVVSGEGVIGLAEFLGAFFFTFGIASVVYGKVSGVLSGVVVGGSLLLGIAIAVLLGSNGVLNPAVAFGIGSWGLMYVFGPILGAICGMQAYKRLM